MGVFEMIVALTAMSISSTIIQKWIKHRTRIAELKINAPKPGSGTSSIELETLRDEVRRLRDITTQYDMSFDSALQSIEQRVQKIETTAAVRSSESEHQRIGH